jgi:hypothetical protein
MTRWRHKKRRSVYEIITDSASLQCATFPDVERSFADESWTVYRNVATGAVYVRPTEEFQDGRFEQVAQTADQREGG